jgi:hypothetical protein
MLISLRVAAHCVTPDTAWPSRLAQMGDYDQRLPRQQVPSSMFKGEVRTESEGSDEVIPILCSPAAILGPDFETAQPRLTYVI